MPNMIYRPEIDGLRALAVLPVILYHAGFYPFAGGFVGVDIFFVISGYLITSIILTEKQSGAFTLLGFYIRRIRRILPALYFVLVVSSIIGLILLSPFDGRDFWQSEVATVLFASNVLFLIKSSDYFSLASEYKPLLHTWSLAVEEQYYVIYPLLLLVAWRAGKRWITVLLMAIAAVSLVFAQWSAYNSAAAGFFLLPARAWELLIGAVIALQLNRENSDTRIPAQNKALYEVCAVGGLLLIGLSIVLFDKLTPFPSIFALLPTVGAGLVIICASSETQIGRLLGSKTLVGVGLISYSAYLWHQPVLAFARYYSLTELSMSQSVVAIALTFGLATMTWWFVEQPFRTRSIVSNRVLFAAAAGFSIVLLCLGVAGHITKGFQDAKLSSVAEKRKYIFVDFFSEVDRKQRAWIPISNSSPVSFSGGARKKVLILGDSMSGDLLIALKGNLALSKNSEFVRQDLPPTVMGAFLDYLIENDGARSAERKLMNDPANLKRLVADSEEIVLAGNWTSATISSGLRLAEYLAMHKQRIYIVDAPRVFHMSASSFYFASSSLSLSELPQFMYKRLSPDYSVVRAQLLSYFSKQAEPKIELIDKGSFFCDFTNVMCTMYSAEGTPLFFDELHLTIEGTNVYGRYLEMAGYFIR